MNTGVPLPPAFWCSKSHTPCTFEQYTRAWLMLSVSFWQWGHSWSYATLFSCGDCMIVLLIKISKRAWDHLILVEVNETGNLISFYHYYFASGSSTVRNTYLYDHIHFAQTLSFCYLLWFVTRNIIRRKESEERSYKNDIVVQFCDQRFLTGQWMY